MNIESIRHYIRVKTRFGLSKIPYLPTSYYLQLGQERIPFRWSSVMPFFNREHALFDYQLSGWDERELRFLWRYLRPGMTFLDIGAYQGLYSIFSALRMENTGAVHALEPNPRDARRIAMHARMNKVSCIQIHELACSDKNGQASFFFPRKGPKTVASLRPSLLVDAKDQEEITVRTITLDFFCEQMELKKIDLLKVDVEGAELQLFAGAEQTLLKKKPLVICEAIDPVTEPWGYRANKILSTLRDDFQYEILEFGQEGRVKLHTIQKYYELCPHSNFLAVPLSKCENILSEFGQA